MFPTELRQSIYRLLLDLIKSDEVITISEIDGIEEASERFGITVDDKEEASRMTLAQAVKCVSTQNQDVRKEIRQTMLNIALRDGECCRAESLLLALMDYICDGDAAGVFSAPLNNRPLIKTQLLYLEDQRSTPGRDAVEADFDELVNMVRLGGFELIYVPKLSEHFRTSSSTEDLRRMLSIVSPQSSAYDLDNTIDALKGMSTRYFYNNVIRSKLEMDMEISDPVWLLRIPDSNVDGVGYANFLCLKVEDDVRAQLQQFISRVSGRMGSYSVQVNAAAGRAGSFPYNGFFKALLDLMSVKRIDKWDVHIRLYGDGMDPYRYIDAGGAEKKCIMTIRKGDEEYPIPLTGRDVAFYMLLLCASANEDEGGVDFHDDTKADLVQARYGQLFRAVSRRVEEPLVWDPVFRVPMRSRVMSAINDSEIARRSSLQTLYQPADRRRGFLYVPIEPDRVIIDTPRGEVKLKDSAVYRQYLTASQQ